MKIRPGPEVEPGMQQCFYAAGIPEIIAAAGPTSPAELE